MSIVTKLFGLYLAVYGMVDCQAFVIYDTWSLLCPVAGVS